MDQLKRLRLEKGLSQAKLAALADIDPSTVNQIERGAREASPATLRKLAAALDVSIAELLEDTSPKAEAPPSLFNHLEERRRDSIMRLDFLQRAEIFRAVSEQLTRGLQRARPDEFPGLVYVSIFAVNGAAKMMREDVKSLSADAAPGELEAAREAEYALKAIEEAVYAISDAAERQNAITARQRESVAKFEDYLRNREAG